MKLFDNNSYLILRFLTITSDTLLWYSAVWVNDERSNWLGPNFGLKPQQLERVGPVDDQEGSTIPLTAQYLNFDISDRPPGKQSKKSRLLRPINWSRTCSRRVSVDHHHLHPLIPAARLDTLSSRLFWEIRLLKFVHNQSLFGYSICKYSF